MKNNTVNTACFMLLLVGLSALACSKEIFPNRGDENNTENSENPNASTSPDMDQAKNCTDRCLANRRQPPPANQCAQNCITLLANARPGVKEKALFAECQDLCTQETARLKQQNALQCKAECEDDVDGDGIDAVDDRCPNTVANAKVALDGCVDGDGDGFSDRVDACPTVGGSEVGPDGCLVQIPPCTTGYCATPTEPSCSGVTCEKERETPILTMIPEQKRIALAKKYLSTRPVKALCPGSLEGVPVPHMVEPPVGVSRQQEEGWERGALFFDVVDGELRSLADAKPGEMFNLADGKAQNQVVDINVQFEPVTVACPPANYSLSVEYYFCDTLPDVEERGHYQELGFCKWLPLDYVSGVPAGVPFAYPLDLGQLFAKLYQPHFQKPAMANFWRPDTNGFVQFSYRLLWLRFQAVAHDGNGQSSAMGMHTEMAHRVVYTYAKGYELSKIPGEAH